MPKANNDPKNKAAARKVKFPFGKGKKKADDNFYKAVPLNEEGEPDEVSKTDRAKGMAQMAAGTVITAAGIPMLVLPGPGVAAIVGGAALTLKGHRTMTGRKPNEFEQSIDDAADRLVNVAKTEAAAVGKKVAQKAADTGAKVVDQGPAIVADAVAHAPENIAHAVQRAPEIASDLASRTPEAAEAAGRAVSRGVQIMTGVSSEVARQGSRVVKEYYEVKNDREARQSDGKDMS